MAGRLVCQQHRRLGAQRSGDCHPLLLASRKLGGKPIRQIAEVERGKKIVGRRSMRSSSDDHRQFDVLPDRQLLQQSQRLRDVTAGVDLAAYRVAQEALTNAVKHAAGAAVTIEVTGAADQLRIKVADTGGSVSAVASGSGRGLAGLAERLAVYGGALTTGRQPAGGWRLEAVIPLQRAQ